MNRITSYGEEQSEDARHNEYAKTARRDEQVGSRYSGMLYEMPSGLNTLAAMNIRQGRKQTRIYYSGQ